MSEKINFGHESHEQHVNSPENAHQSHERASESRETHHKHEHKENLENIRHRAEQAATEADRTRIEAEPGQSHAPKQAFVNKELKDMAYARTMNRVRQQLSPVGRSFSKIIHQPVVDAVSEGAAKTVGRPSGLFGGGLLALVGTTIYYWITKHYGYDYNFFVFLLLLAVGFALGWFAEVLWRLSGHRSKS
jgi:hypothetical protein